jgi:AraC family transcriptional regulator
VLRPRLFVSVQRRIQVLEDGRWVPLVDRQPALSSAALAWDGVLLEEHFTGPTATKPRHIRSVFLALQTGKPCRHDWRSSGKLHRTFASTRSIHLLPPGPERSLTYRDPTDAIVVSIEPAFLRAALGDSLVGDRLELLEKFAFEDVQIERLMKGLHAETKSAAPSGRLFGQSLATALAIYLAQRYSTSSPKLDFYSGGMPKTRLKRVLEYIGANLNEDLSLVVLADVSGMNLYYFARLFTESMGVSPHRYVLEQRIQRAKQLLQVPKTTVFEAAMRTGFSDQAHFTKVFRRIVGVTPTKYRAYL